MSNIRTRSPISPAAAIPHIFTLLSRAGLKGLGAASTSPDAGMRGMPVEFPVPAFDKDDLEIPAFLRRRN